MALVKFSGVGADFEGAQPMVAARMQSKAIIVPAERPMGCFMRGSPCHCD